MKGFGEGDTQEKAIKEAHNDAIRQLSEMIYLYAQSISYEFFEGDSDDLEQVRKMALTLYMPPSQIVKALSNKVERIDQWTNPVYRVDYINDEQQPELGDQIEYIAYTWMRIPSNTIISLKRRYKKLIKGSSSKMMVFSHFDYDFTDDQDLDVLSDRQISYAPGQRILLSPKQKAPSWINEESINMKVHDESYICFVGQGDAKTFRTALELAKRDALSKIVESLGFFVSSKSADAWLEDEKGMDNILMEQFVIKSGKFNMTSFIPIHTYTEHIGVVKDAEGGNPDFQEPLIRGYILLGMPDKDFQQLLIKPN